MGVEIEMNEKEIISKYRIEDCTRCKNECAAACPVFRHYGTNHPQQLAHTFLSGGERAARDHRLIWTCVTCAACTEACPFSVPFPDFVLELREGRTDCRPVFGGMIRRYQETEAAASSGSQKGMKGAVAATARLSWLDPASRVEKEGEIALFAGCLALFDAVAGPSCERSFGEMGRSAVKLLNALGVSPVILEDERCCGRDLRDLGAREAFLALARHNVEAIAKSKARTVLAICPECAFTLKDTYVKELGPQPFEVRHVTEFIAGRLDALAFTRGSEIPAFHDPCYLCRRLGESEAPRKILERLCSAKPVELERRERNAPCCGAGSWVEHGPHTRTAASERLREAHRCGADTLVTACPKCTLLYHEVSPGCSWRESPVAVKDLITLAASRLDTRRSGTA
jgi:heterodisulfide reductase subunit D